MDVIDHFIRWAKERPDLPAIAEDRRVYSYGQLYELVGALVNQFSRVEIPVVLIACKQGAVAYASMIASALAGGFYSPVNVQSPQQKIRNIIEALRPNIVVASLEDFPLANEFDFIQVRIDSNNVPSSKASFKRHRCYHRQAYIAFTSGSTGMPKGVVIPRQGLNHYISWWRKELRVGPQDRLSQHPNIGFDLSVPDIYGALSSGACLFPFSIESDRLFPARKIARDRITLWNSVPSIVDLMETANELNSEYLSSVNIFTFCGEPLLSHQLATLFDARPDCIVYNTYGPTEATVAVSYKKITADNYQHLCNPTAALGQPIGKMRVDLLRSVEQGGEEIVISGPQLAIGYHEDPDATAKAFRPLERDGQQIRTYFTGDIATKRDDELYFFGRGDQMIKVRGYRIEIGEIQTAFERLGWQPLRLFLYQGELCALVKNRADRKFEARSVRKKLSESLDSYAIPTHIGAVDMLPLSTNDKSQLDERELFALIGER
ncbi:AMP-binding protein [Labrenzia sp. DG1229]|uniref:AMP-binding protein n=1 Tax=Labrenzia sp. DG1229 TaxID=681847 RepID=UPI00048F68BF|nr:AMP-binding protein [Labrenzia sp. DG1229]